MSVVEMSSDSGPLKEPSTSPFSLSKSMQIKEPPCYYFLSPRKSYFVPSSISTSWFILNNLHVSLLGVPVPQILRLTFLFFNMLN